MLCQQKLQFLLFKELEKRAEELEKELANNKYLYDIHVELVGIYKKLTDLKSLRAAYERFHECYPLTPQLWLSWIRDEIKIANSDTEKKYVVSLFDLAVQDYLCKYDFSFTFKVLLMFFS